jgi:hypothetical protein
MSAANPHAAAAAPSPPPASMEVGLKRHDEGHDFSLDEVFDADILDALLKHEGMSTEIKKKMKKIKRRIHDGNRLTVLYAFNNKERWGRAYAVGALGAQSLDRQARNALYGTKNWDVDCKTAQPTILVRLAELADLPCDHWRRYVSGVDECRAELTAYYPDMNLDDAKGAVIALMYFAGVPQSADIPQNPLMLGLKAEIKRIAMHYKAAFPEMYKEAIDGRKAKNKSGGDPMASFMASLLGTEENKVVEAMKRFFDDAHRLVRCLMYDGCHIPRLESDNGTPPVALLPPCEAAITAATSYDIKLAFKPMVTNLKLKIEVDDDKRSDFEICRDVLLGYAEDKKMVRVGDLPWEPVPDTICGFAPVPDIFEYKQLLNSVLMGCEAYQRRPQTFRDLDFYVKNIDHDSFRIIRKRDQDLVSFPNGVFVLSTATFVANEAEKASDYAGRVARHHIDCPWTGGTETPLFDKVALFQLSADIYKWLLIMIGRLFFPIKSHDNWQVMLLIFGIGRTGKSTIVNAVLAMFAAAAVEGLSSNSEVTFGLQRLVDKELITCEDLPSDKPCSSVMLQDVFQKIVVGAPQPVNRKNATAITVALLAQMLWAGNRYIDYPDTSDNIARRIFGFHFKRALDDSQEVGDLEARIIATELPNLLNKCITAYLSEVAASGNRGIWDVAPPYFMEVREQEGSKTNYLKDFLTSPKDAAQSKWLRCYAIKEDGAMTTMDSLKKAFDRFMKKKHADVPLSVAKWSAADKGPILKLGYKLDTKMTCKRCGNPARKRGGPVCCKNYDNANRTRTEWVEGLKIVWERRRDEYTDLWEADDVAPEDNVHDNFDWM